jgi:hypothetical protein
MSRVDDQADTLRRLHDLADAPEPATESARIDRLTACYLLAVAYGNIDSEIVDFLGLHAVEDRFALARTSDAYCRRYLDGALPMFPRLPVVVREILGHKDFLRAKPGGFMLDLVRARHMLLAHDTPGWIEGGLVEHRLWNLEWIPRAINDPVAWWGRRLLLDRREEVALHEQLLRLGLGVTRDPAWRATHLARLAHERRGVLAVDESTAAFEEARALVTDAEAWRSLEQEIAANVRLGEILASADPGLREWALLAPFHSISRLEAWISWPARATNLAPLRLHPRDGRRWASTMEGTEDGFVLVGGHPTWVLQRESCTLGTGPRPVDARRSDEVRYHGDAAGPDNLMVIDGRVARDLTVRFTVSFATTGRPDVAFLFGARDLDCDPPERRSHGHLLLLGEDAVRRMTWREAARRRGGYHLTQEARTLALEEADARPFDLRGRARLDLAIRIGDEIVITIDGATATMPAPADRLGFYGLRFTGVGDATVSALAIEGVQ